MYIALTVSLLACLVALTDPFMLLMPTMMQMAALLIASALLTVWVGILMREKSEDERQAHNRMFADRNAYIIGTGILTIVLVVQGFEHSIESWVPLTIAAMIATKAVSRWYADTYL